MDTGGALVRIYRMPGASIVDYDRVVATAGDVIAAGAELHLAGETDSDLWVIEAWPTAAALAQWQESQVAGRSAQEALLPEPEVIEFIAHRLLT